MVLSTSGIALAGSHCNDAGTVCSGGSSQGGFRGGGGRTTAQCSERGCPETVTGGLVVAALVALVLVVQVALVEVVVEVNKNHVLQVCTIVAVRSMAVAPSHNQDLNLDLILAPEY